MNLFWAMLAYLLMAVVLCWGILAMVHGNPWILIAGVLVYSFLFAKLGCLPKKGDSAHTSAH